MISIQEKTACCGCSACAAVCPQQCISLESDDEGFWYPHVDTSLCTDCHLCEKACPVLSPQAERIPLHVYAAINRDEEVRARSASGGMFSLIAEKILAEGGVVFGVRFNESWEAVFGYTETREGLEAFRRSKYVQAWVGDSYHQVKAFLQKGRKVLFSGTPCQIAGLKSFLKRDFDNLLTVDLICTGVPSPLVWKRYLKEEAVRYAKKYVSSFHPLSKEDVKVKEVSFRHKANGWQCCRLSLTLAAAGAGFPHTYYVDERSAYMQLMMKGVTHRPVCYECPFKSGKSRSDLTMGDYWGISRRHPEMDDDKGTSMVFVNTEKGERHLDLSRIKYVETTYKETWPYNNVVTSTRKHPRRDYFYSQIKRHKGIIKLMNKIIYPLSGSSEVIIVNYLKRTLGEDGYKLMKEKLWDKFKR